MSASVNVLARIPTPAEFERIGDDTPMHETTPGSITKKIVEFCESLNAGPPEVLAVAPAPGARIGMCADNVLRIVRQAGGTPVYGWYIWEAPAIFLTGEFHCAWRKPDGELVDVTPNMDGESSVVFAPARDVPPDFDFRNRPANRRTRLYENPDRAALVEERIRALTPSRLAYESLRAARKGLTLPASMGLKLPRDKFETRIDEFMQEAGELEANFAVRPNGTVSTGMDMGEMALRAEILNRKRNCLFLIARLMARGEEPRI